MRAIRLIVFISLSFFCSLPVFAQKAENVQGQYSFFVDENANITFADARIKAIENARVEALKEAFGTMISSDIVTEMVSDSEGGAHSELREITQETARGEWLSDTSEPVVSIRYDKELHSFVYDVSISGKARKISKSKTEFIWTVLNDDQTATKDCDTFYNGDHIYVSFKTPALGYVAIYLIEDNGLVSCLLPYPDDESGVQMVRSGQKYLFFDKQADPSAFRYKLKTNRKVENNIVYLIFSPNPFTKCVDEKSDPKHPNTLSVAAFEKWRFQAMQNDDRMVAEKKWVRIINNQE